MDEGYTCNNEYECEAYNPTKRSNPTDAIDVEKEIGEPLVASDKVACVDEGDI